MENLIISDKQAYEFAKAIFADIEIYIENHKEEYELFLKEEKNAQLGEAKNETNV